MSLKDELTDLFGDSYSFGADIGTSCCFMAYKEGPAYPPKVPNYRGVSQGGIPSLFWRDAQGNEWVCDQVAEKQGLVEDPAGVCASVKMKLGEKQIVLNGHPYTPRVVSIKEVKRVLELSRQALEQEMVDMNLVKLVCGVPHRYTAAEKGELHYILQEATGIRNIRLVGEGTLAALTNDYYTKKTGRKPGPVLVVDMGGGTTDIVLLLPNENPTPEEPEPYVARNPDGLREAGDALDALMEKLILEKVRREPGSVKLSILNDPNHFDRRRLRQTAKETKERLSSVDSCAVSISGIECGSAVVTVTRAEYEARIRPMFQRVVDLAAKVLSGCGMGVRPEVDILLVGGATYTPLLRTLLEEKFPWLDKSRIMQRFPEKAVALGAAIYAEMPEIVRPRVAYGYAVNTHINDGKDEVLRVVIPSGADLPMTVKANFHTLDQNQQYVSFSVYEVENGRDSEHLAMNRGRATAYSISHGFGVPVAKGTPVSLTTTLTEDGVLTMTVEDFQAQRKTTTKTFTMNNTVMDG